MKIQNSKFKRTLTTSIVAASLILPAGISTTMVHPTVARALPKMSIKSTYWKKPHSFVLSHTVRAKAIKDDPTDEAKNKVAGTVVFPAGDHVKIYLQGTNGINVNISDATHQNGKHDMQYTYPLHDTSSQVIASITPNKTAKITGSKPTSENNNHQSTRSSSHHSSDHDTSQNNSTSSSQITPQKKRIAFKQATVIGIVTFVVLYVLYGIKRLFNRHSN